MKKKPNTFEQAAREYSEDRFSGTGDGIAYDAFIAGALWAYERTREQDKYLSEVWFGSARVRSNRREHRGQSK